MVQCVQVLAVVQVPQHGARVLHDGGVSQTGNSMLPSKGKKRVTAKDEYCSYAFLPLDGSMGSVGQYGDSMHHCRVRKVARFPIFLNLELLFCEIFECKE